MPFQIRNKDETEQRQTEGISCHEKKNRSCCSLFFFFSFKLKETPLRKSSRRGGGGGWDSRKNCGPKLAAPFRLGVPLIELISCDCWTSKDSAD